MCAADDLVLNSEREAPRHVIDGLRNVDPDATLLYAGEGVWVLGVVRPRSRQVLGGLPRRQTAWKIMAHERVKLNPDPVALRLAELMLRDFFEIARYKVQGSPTYEIVHDFAERDWNWKYAADETFERHLDETEDGPAWREMRRKYADYAQTEARDTYRHVFKGRRSLLVNRH